MAGPGSPGLLVGCLIGWSVDCGFVLAGPGVPEVLVGLVPFVGGSPVILEGVDELLPVLVPVPSGLVSLVLGQS